MANDKRTCDACGRPLTGRKRKDDLPFQVDQADRVSIVNQIPS